MKYYLYILRSQVKGTYYTGISNDPERRLYFHNHHSNGYTSRDRPWKIVYRKAFDTESEARAAEKQVKSWKSRKMTRLLVE